MVACSFVDSRKKAWFTCMFADRLAEARMKNNQRMMIGAIWESFISVNHYVDYFMGRDIF